MLSVNNINNFTWNDDKLLKYAKEGEDTTALLESWSDFQTLVWWLVTEIECKNCQITSNDQWT